jgi:SAM-dependent methyltransferase
MSNNNVPYLSNYFDSDIFDTDYRTLALAIFDTYHPQIVAEFGCGPGHLTRELAKLGVKVTAVDGFSQPDFSGLSIEFHRVNLNDPTSIANVFTEQHFDLAICLEVAEHLQPEASPTLVNWLTQVAPIVVFSASVPGQGGHGHINLSPRDYWHNLFTNKNFVITDRIREKLRLHASVAPWYRYNVLDYVSADHPQAPQANEVIYRLIASESDISTGLYEESTKLTIAQNRLNYTPVQWYLGFRRFAKKLTGKG